MRRAALVTFVLAAAALVYWWTRGAAPPPERAATTDSARHVLLITIDTLRADHVGSYGHDAARTPALDALAARGARFTRAFATAPITLTSHASMLTGLLPPGHGARHNGLRVRAEVPTVAEVFAQAGFETAAFVSAFPLDKRFGLARGFQVYDDEMPRGADGRRANERPGATTIDRAIAWTRERGASTRRFAWVHLFEPHAPYGTPGSPGSVLERYDEEVATADREIARLLDAWPDLSSTLVVAAADHGEAFGEHGEIGHSIFVYDTTLRVPLILAGPAVPGAAIEDPVTVADIAPTILALMGLPRLDSDGQDLGPLLRGEELGSRALYAESFAPLLDFGWAPLRSLRRDGMKLIAAPRPELYDVRADGGESINVFDERAEAARELKARVDRISGPELPPDQGQADPDALARLRALGYASGGRSGGGGTRPDPKDRIDAASRMASVTSGELTGEAAARALRDVLQIDGGNPQAHLRLGFILAESGRCSEAEKHFAAAIASAMPSADPYLGLAMCQAQAGRVQEAVATLESSRRVEPGNPVVEANIGLSSLELGRVSQAIDALQRALSIDPDLHQARFALARALARDGRREEALREATTLLERLPSNAPQRPEVERLIGALR